MSSLSIVRQIIEGVERLLSPDKVALNGGCILRILSFNWSDDHVDRFLPLDPNSFDSFDITPTTGTSQANTAAGSTAFASAESTLVAINVLFKVMSVAIGGEAAVRARREIDDLVFQMAVDTWGVDGVTWPVIQKWLQHICKDSHRNMIDQVAVAVATAKRLHPEDWEARWAAIFKAGFTAVGSRSLALGSRLVEQARLRRQVHQVKSCFPSGQAGGGSGASGSIAPAEKSSLMSAKDRRAWIGKQLGISTAAMASPKWWPTAMEKFNREHPGQCVFDHYGNCPQGAKGLCHKCSS